MRVADETIEVVLLPDGSCSIQIRINPASSHALPRFDDVRDSVARAEHDVRVIFHHAPCEEFVTAPVVVDQRVDNEPRCCLSQRNTFFTIDHDCHELRAVFRVPMRKVFSFVYGNLPGLELHLAEGTSVGAAARRWADEGVRRP